jgi:DNA polymerase
MDWKGGTLKKENPGMYSLAKARVLGLGYGLGHVKFKEKLSNEYGLNVDLVEAQRIVKNFRYSNKGITSLWYKYQTLLSVHIGANMYVKLPSGRPMYFCKVQKETLGDFTCQFAMDGIRHTIYGAQVVENIVQAIARDIFIDGMLKLWEKGYSVLFHVHDEFVLEVSEGEEVKPIKELLSIPPVWFPDIPLAVEASLEDHYLK